MVETVVNNPNRVILHCSATPDYKDADKLYDLFGVKDINEWHKKRGFSKVGYHRVIRRTGEIEKGREFTEVGAHTQGENTDTLGVCYIGSKRPTAPQVNSLIVVYREIRDKFGIRPAQWFGHYEFAPKDCPGIAMTVIRSLFEMVDEIDGVP